MGNLYGRFYKMMRDGAILPNYNISTLTSGDLQAAITRRGEILLTVSRDGALRSQVGGLSPAEARILAGLLNELADELETQRGG